MLHFSPAEVDAAAALVAQWDDRATHHVLALGGCETRWRIWGTGTPLVLIHGGHGSWMHWIRNIEALSLHFQVIAPDLAGFGDSADFELDAHDPARLQRLVESLRLGVEHLAPAGPLHLAGFSFGGAVAGLLASQLPRLQRLALLGCGGHGGTRHDQTPMLDWRAHEGAPRWQALQQNVEAFMLSCPADALALYVHGHACERTRFRSKAFSRSPLLLQALQHFEQPVLMVWGDDDVTALPDRSRAGPDPGQVHARLDHRRRRRPLGAVRTSRGHQHAAGQLAQGGVIQSLSRMKMRVPITRVVDDHFKVRVPSDGTGADIEGARPRALLTAGRSVPASSREMP